MALLYLLNVSGGNCSQSSARAPAGALLCPPRARAEQGAPGPAGPPALPCRLLSCKSKDSRLSALKIDGHCFLEAFYMKET